MKIKLFKIGRGLAITFDKSDFNGIKTDVTKTFSLTDNNNCSSTYKVKGILNISKEIEICIDELPYNHNGVSVIKEDFKVKDGVTDVIVKKVIEKSKSEGCNDKLFRVQLKEFIVSDEANQKIKERALLKSKITNAKDEFFTRILDACGKEYPINFTHREHTFTFQSDQVEIEQKLSFESNDNYPCDYVFTVKLVNTNCEHAAVDNVESEANCGFLDIIPREEILNFDKIKFPYRYEFGGKVFEFINQYVKPITKKVTDENGCPYDLTVEINIEPEETVEQCWSKKAIPLTIFGIPYTASGDHEIFYTDDQGFTRMVLFKLEITSEENCPGSVQDANDGGFIDELYRSLTDEEEDVLLTPWLNSEPNFCDGLHYGLRVFSDENFDSFELYKDNEIAIIKEVNGRYTTITTEEFQNHKWRIKIRQGSKTSEFSNEVGGATTPE